MEKIGTRFRQDVSSFAEDHHIPIVRFNKDDRKIDVMRSLPGRAGQRPGRSGVAAIGVAQEFQNVFAGNQHHGNNGVPWFSFTKADRRVTCFYFYLWDTDFGAAFIKICTYFPYPIKVWVNGHEWAKRQATAAGIGFTALSNGFATCDDPAALQAICDRLGPGTIEVFFERWMSRLPVPLTEHDRTDGYWWELSMRQVEVSRTLVFDAPRRARAFFEALVVDNLDIGRPDNVELIFTGPPHRRGRRPVKLDCAPKTSIVTRDTDVTVNAFFKHSRVKQYLKDGRALRIETVVNSPDDLRCHRRLQHLDQLQTKARAVNARLLDTERVGQGCVLASPAFERVALSTLTADGRRAPALRFGDPRVMALLGALCVGLNALGFTNRSLRAQVSRLLGARLHRQPDELRPGPVTTQRPHRTHPRHQHLRPDRRRTTSRDLLHQGPQPAPATTARREQTTRTPELRARAAHHRPARPQLHRPRTPRETPPENSRSTSKFHTPRNATPLPGLRPAAVAPSGQLWSPRAGDLTVRGWSMSSAERYADLLTGIV